jgi:hypothetical protein
MQPVVSVIIVSDYAAGEHGSWEDLRAAFHAWTQQDFAEPVEYLLVEHAAYERQVPADLLDILPSLRVVYSADATSYELKNAGVQAASAPLVALVDADCIPRRDWLRRLVIALREHPQAAVISGKTVYAGKGLQERVLGLLTRAYLDPGRFGKTAFISNSSAGFRREVCLAYPLPSGAGAFASRLQSEAMRRDGRLLLFDPGLQVTHDFSGWAMECDIRRNIGYGTVITRLRDRRMPYAWLTRLGYSSIPVIATGKTLFSFWDCLRCGAQYNVRWFEMPAAWALAALTRLLEIPGMVRAFRGGEMTGTAYR